MQKTSVYLPDDLKRDLERAAEAEGQSEAAIIRDAVRRRVADSAVPRPRLPLVARPLGDPGASQRVDELLAEGFGE